MSHSISRRGKMRRKNLSYFFGIFMFFLVASITAKDTNLIIYNRDFAIVKDIVDIELKKGENILNFEKVSLKIDPESVLLLDSSSKKYIRIRRILFRKERHTRE